MKSTKPPFGIMQDYLSDIDASNTQSTISELIGVGERTISNWCRIKFTKSKKTEKAIPELVKNFFYDKRSKQGFIERLDRYGYDVDKYQKYDDIPDDVFEDFLLEFFLENIKKKTNPSEKKNAPSELFIHKKIKNYFPQTLHIYNVNPSDFDDVIFDCSRNEFSQINEKHRILIEGPGGQGKSLFLKTLLRAASKSDNYSYVFCIDLPELISLTKKEIAPFTNTETPYILSYLSFIAEDISEVVECISGNSKKVLLLLDGLNEIFAMSDSDAAQQIIDELELISGEWLNTTIIITTRPSGEKRSFLNAYDLCHISGTPTEKYEEISNETSISNNIKNLAKIPMYYNAIVELNGKKIRTNYDLLFNIYLKKYKQSFKNAEAFTAYFVFAPLFMKEMVDSNRNRINYSDVLHFAKKFKKMNLDAFIRLAQRECNVTYPISDDVDTVCSIFLYNGPLELSSITNNRENYKIHDEIRDFLLAFLAVVSLKVFRESLEDDGQYIYVRDIDFLLNLKDNASFLLKEKLGLFSGEDLYKLEDQYAVLKDCKINGQAILYAYTLFMLSDNLGLGSSAVEPTHKILIGFTNRIKRLVLQNNFENCLRTSGDQSIRCKNSILDVFTKHLEYYRKSSDYFEGIKLTEVAEKINPEYNPILHQKSKLYLLMYESHIKDNKTFDLQSIGLSTYSELYTKAKELLEMAASNNFNFSNILLATLHSTPAPYLYNNPKTRIEIDYIKAFHLYRSLLFDAHYPRYVAKRVSYALRQAIGLILNGFVKFNPDFEVYEGGDPGENSVVLGDKNALDLDENSIKLAKYFLKNADGINANTMNYFKGVIAYYDQDLISAKHYFNLESDLLLKSIFQHYLFNEPVELQALYEDVKKKIIDRKYETIEKIHPVYWYCQMKALDLSFNKERKSFFDKFEEDLPDSFKEIIKKITQ